MSYWQIIAPEGTTNLVTNPSIEVDTTGWSAMAGAIAQTQLYHMWGLYSMSVTPSSAVNDGTYFGTVSLTNGSSYTFSVYVKGVASEPYKLYFANTSGTLQGTATSFTATGGWERQEVTWACTSSASYRLYVTKDNDANVGTFYLDGAQCEEKAYSTSYCDGTLDGCEWHSTTHASATTRHVGKALGGRIYDLEDDFDLTVEDMPGSGMPPIEQNILETPIGDVLLGTKAAQRTIDLLATQNGETHEDLHANRKALLDVLRPDKSVAYPRVVLCYSGTASDSPIYISCVYDSGYEYGALRGFNERQLPLRFIAYEPFFFEDGEAARQLITSDVLSLSCFIAEVGGVYSAMGAGTSTGTIYAITSDDEYLYICGNFSNWAGISDADCIARYNFETGTWSALGTGTTSGIPSVMLLSASGDLYVAGTFTSMGGVSNTAYIAMWDGSSWNALGTGMNDDCLALAFDNNGLLYAGGAFTTAGGTAAVRIATWDGSAWANLSGDDPDDNQVEALLPQKDGSLLVGGSFTGVGSDSALSGVAKWDDGTWTDLAGGTTGTVLDIIKTRSGVVYMSGTFTTIGGATCNRIATWDGYSFSDLQEGVNGTARSIWYDEDSSLLYLCGDFTVAGGLALTDRVAAWNGSTWAHLDFDLAGSVSVYSVYTVAGNLYVGFNGTLQTHEVAYLSAIVNEGTRLVYPKIVIKRSGGSAAVVQSLKNKTTGVALWFDYALEDGEELTIDFRPGKRYIETNMYSPRWDAMLRNSDFNSFYLLPGTNSISAFVNESGSPTVLAYIVYKKTHWSIDGVA